jgi:outer membrane protein
VAGAIWQEKSSVDSPLLSPFAALPDFSANAEARRLKGKPLLAVLVAAHVALVGGVAAADAALTDFEPDYLPNFAGLGPGFVPDYIGSDDYRFGVAPFARVSWGERYVDFIANFARANVLEHENWRFGPSGTLRLARDSVEDDVVDRLPDIDATLELGAFVGYVVNTGDDPRNRLRAKISFTHDVLGESDGFVVAASLKKWFPVGRFGAFGVSVGTTYASDDHADTYYSVSAAGSAASGLPIFSAGGGLRDARVTAVFAHPISESVILGAGALYGRMLGDAADSPIVSDRGSKDQFIVGVGGAFLFR